MIGRPLCWAESEKRRKTLKHGRMTLRGVHLLIVLSDFRLSAGGQPCMVEPRDYGSVALVYTRADE